MQALLTQQALVFMIIGIGSMLSHAIKKWIQGEIRGNLIDWYIHHPQMSVAAVLACIGGISTALLAGQLTDYSVGAQVIAAWGIGYAADTVNTQGEK